VKQFFPKLAMTVAMLLSFLPASAYDFEADGIYYNITDATNHEAEVTNNGTGIYSGNINIPSTVIYRGTTYPVTAIGEHAFFHCPGLTSVTIPNSVTSIGECAFLDCKGLAEINVDTGNKSYTSVDGVLYNKNLTEIIQYPSSKTGTTFTIPSSVTSIGNYAFNYCTGLTSITIPNSVTSIGRGAFDYCYGLTSVTIPNSVTSIGRGAFYGCYSLTSIIIPDSVTSIKYCAFYGCYSLTSIIIPNSVIYIEGYAFYSCYNLTSITIPNSVTSIEEWAFQNCSGLTSVTIGNSVTSIGEGAFSGCKGLTSITIPNSVTSIGRGAFSGCTGLTSIAIPNSVTSIGDYAFNNCPLKSIYCHWKEPLKIDYKGYDDIFSSNCYEDATLYVPKGCADKYKSTHPWSNFRNIEESDNLGIEDILENQHTGGYIVYDLQGVLRLQTENIDEVNQLPSGLYIVNGKKVLIR